MDKEIINKEKILNAEGLFHIYESKALDGNVVALNGLDLVIREGEKVAVYGPSGSGKSTMLKCLGALMKPTAGIVSIGGTNITRMTGQELIDLRQKTISFIFQEGNLLPHMHALDNVAQPLRHAGVKSGEARKKAAALLEELGILERAYSLPKLLSGGEQQRVSIARALITEPKLILADEPTGALDPITSREVIELFDELNEKKGVAFLVVTHNEEVASFADRVVELRDGKIIDSADEDFQAFAKVRMVPAPQCPACKHDYGVSKAEECPSCGSSRPRVRAQ